MVYENPLARNYYIIYNDLSFYGYSSACMKISADGKIPFHLVYREFT